MAKKKKTIKQKPVISIPDNSNSSAIIAKPRISVLCKAYNISDETLVSFLSSKGYRGLSLNSMIDEDAIRLVKIQFQSDKIDKDKIRGLTSIEFTNVESNVNFSGIKSNRKQYDTISENREPVLHLTQNLFSNSKRQVVYKGYLSFVSFFDDSEAINLCSKMSSSFTRKLCKQLYNPKVDRQLVLYQIHHIANKALTIFGGKILTFIHGLRNLNFKNQVASEIKNYSKVIPDFPILSLTTNDINFKISFFVKRRKDKRLQADIRLFAPNTYQEIGWIDEEGYIMGRLDYYKPELNLFYQSTKDNNFKIYSGVETGNCEICGKELSHPVSIRIGIGPICAKNKRVDAALYNFK